MDNSNSIISYSGSSLKSSLLSDNVNNRHGRSVNLGFVKLGDDSIPKTDKSYSIVSAGDEYLFTLKYPETRLKLLKLDIYALYIEDLPDFTKKNEGLLKIGINTKDPQNLTSADFDATVVTNFKVKDGNYSTNFLYKGIYRNALFDSWINLKFDLFELDTDADVYFSKVKKVVDGVPEIKDLNILKGIPYLNLATQLFESIITVFGKNPDDHVWNEIPILELEPTPGGAFLRSGIYVIFEEKNRIGEQCSVSDFEYVNGRMKLSSNSKISEMSNHLLFGIKIDSYGFETKS